MFYYAGHGVSVAGRNYLIPVDANIERASDVEFESIDANRVLAGMQEFENDLNMLILDACRNNPYSVSYRNISKSLSPMQTARGSLILYAASAGEVASDGVGRNGLFTNYLIQETNLPGLKVEDVFKRTAHRVYYATQKKQLPWQSGVILGDFYFSSPEKRFQTPETTSPAAIDENEQAEIEYWSSIKDTKKTEYYTAYLSRYGVAGIFSGLAKIKQQELLQEDQKREAATARLTVRTRPQQAKISILNRHEKYHDGIKLKPGRYHIAVEMSGYKRHLEWVEMADVDRIFSVILEQKPTVAASPEQTAVTEPEFIQVQGGCYQMGSPKWESGHFENERQQKVCVNDVAIAKHEVTVAQFRQFIESTGYRTEAELNIEKDGCWTDDEKTKAWDWRLGFYWNNPGFQQSGQHPVICVSWNDANHYINGLNAETGKQYRFPNEAEWEYAARAGSRKARY